MNKNNEYAIQLNLYDAINFGLIEYQPDVKSYILSTTEETLYTHTASEDPLPAFIKFLSKDKEESHSKYKIIMDQLGYWNQE
jgi:hypothetical protein